MGAESKNLVTISYVTDTDVSYYHIGEVEGSFQKEEPITCRSAHG